MVMERVSLPDAANLNDIAEDVCLEGDIEHRTNDVIAMCRACLDGSGCTRPRPAAPGSASLPGYRPPLPYFTVQVAGVPPNRLLFHCTLLTRALAGT